LVERLDQFIIGQADAKKAVGVALRNRWRRYHLPTTLREEVIPKNILLVGPTGCGKTEIARRLAQLTNAPFIEVEATKSTKVGYQGRDVDCIIKDLVDVAIVMEREKRRQAAARRTQPKEPEVGAGSLPELQSQETWSSFAERSSAYVTGT